MAIIREDENKVYKINTFDYAVFESVSKYVGAIYSIIIG